MKLSSRARYALRLIVELERHGGGKQPVHLAKISQVTGISRRYLDQLAMALKSHSLIRGVAGRKGGYRLGRPSAAITIGDVLTAVIGPLNLSICVNEPEICMRANICECRLIWSLLQQRMSKVLEEFTIADLLDSRQMEKIRGQLEEVGEAGMPEKEHGPRWQRADCSAELW